MATISSSIALKDNLSAIADKMVRSLYNVSSGFERVEAASQNIVNTRAITSGTTSVDNLSKSVRQYERSINEAENSQRSFNNATAVTTGSMTGLIGKLGALAAGYMSLQAIGNFIGMSDTYSQTTARIGLMNDGLQTTAELQNDIFNAANDSHAAYQDTADMVSKLGLMAGDAFSSSSEIVDFAEQVSKQFVISGASAGEASNAMLQLTQAMASGVLRGDELNSIFENSPTLIQAIADYMEVPIGEIRNMASEGQITASVIKNSMFKATDATNKKFEAMGMTFGQSWTIFQNKSSKAFQGVFTQLGKLANSQELDGFLNSLASGVGVAADIVSTVGSGIAEVYNLPVVQSTIATMSGMLPNIEGIGDTISSVVESVKSGLEKNTPAIDQAVTSLDGSVTRLKNLLGAEPPDIAWIGEAVAEVVREVTYLTTFLNDSYAIISGWGKVLGDGFKLITGTGDAGTLEQFKMDYSSLDDSYTAFHNDVLSYMGATGTESATAYTGSFREVLTGDTQTATAAIRPMENIPQQTNILGQQAGANYGAGLLANQSFTEIASTGLATATTTPLQNIPGNLTLIGSDGVAGMSGAIANGTGGAEQSAAGVASGINKMFAPIPGDTRTIADCAMAGLEAGLGNSGGVEKTIISLTTMLLNTFKDKLGIHSPSTEMYDIGTNTMAGLMNSLADSDLAQFCENIVADMKTAFEAGSFNLQAGIEYIGGGAAEFFKSIGIGGASLGQLIQPVAGDVTSGFGYRSAEETNGIGSLYHEGIDIGAAYGDAVGAAGAGTVIFAGYNGGYGNMVEIDHGGGLTSLYAHLSSILVSVGDIVSKLQTIGLVGSTGNSTGAHLHFGLYQDGAAIDPSALFGGYASGTNYATRGLHLVGENGPEIMSFAGGEKVLDADKSKAILSGAGKQKTGSNKTFAPIIKINMGDTVVNSEMDIEKVAKQIGRKFKEEVLISANDLYAM